VIGNKNVVGLNELALELDQILAVLGQGYVKSVAYDTAWVARLSDMYRGQGFDEALPWVRRHQHSDGSWGGDVLHYHDRFICTLASIITLHTIGSGTQDAQRVQSGVEFL